MTRVASGNPEILELAIDLDLDELELAPTSSPKPWIEAHCELATPRLVLRPARRGTLTSCLDEDLDPLELSDLVSRTKAQVEDIPRCLSGGREVTWTTQPLDVLLATEPNLEALEHFVESFTAERYRAKSLRCRNCTENSGCGGQLVQRLRAFGLAQLVPRQ